MNTKELADMLMKRADAYEEPYQGNQLAFVESKTSYAIATTMRELASMLRSLDQPEQDSDQTTE